MPWSPLARGRLARPWDEVTERSATDEFGKSLYLAESDRTVVERVAQVAEDRGVPMGAGGAGVDVLEAGRDGADRRRHQAAPPRRRRGRPRRAAHAEEIAALEEPYVPHPVVGFA